MDAEARRLLKEALRILGNDGYMFSYEIRDFLDAEPEAEPVAWVKITQYGDRRLSLDKLDGYEPLYTKPSPARKPMSEEEIQKHSIFWLLYDQKSFVAGIRFAEKRHGIGGDDDTRTADE